MTTTRTLTITIPASRYEDSDTCLADAVLDVATAIDLAEWECSAAWGHDRETILVTIPRPHANDAVTWDAVRMYEGCPGR